MEVLDQITFNWLRAVDAVRRSRGKCTWADLPFSASDLLADPAVLLRDLVEKGLLLQTEEGLSVSDTGYRLLAPYQVKRAIIMAAGLGTRMRPLTDRIPKPLIPVLGTPIIETLLRAIEAQGIPEILIVTGHLGHLFSSLKARHPSIRSFHNDRYETENNLSSANLVRNFFGNAYVMDADLFLRNPSLIRRYEYQTGYCGIAVERTDDWYLSMKGQRVVGMFKRSDSPCHLMVGLSYWYAAAG